MEITEEKKSVWGKNENDGIMPHNGSVLNSYTQVLQVYQCTESCCSTVAITLISILQMEKK